MTVTSFVFLKLTCGPELPPEFLEKIDKVIDIQDAFVAERHPESAQNRAACFYQQIEDPSIGMAVVEWPSVETYMTWTTIPNRNEALEDLAEYTDYGAAPASLIIAEGSFFLTESKNGERVPLLESQHIEATRWHVASSKKADFLSNYEVWRRHHMKHDTKHLIAGSWSEESTFLDLNKGDLSEFIVVRGYGTPGKEESKSSSNALSPEAVLKRMVSFSHATHWTRTQ